MKPEDNVPSVAVCPPLRCFAPGGAGPHHACGELASWKRPGKWWFSTEYFCDEHREPTDVAIAGDAVVRRVRVTLEVLISGADLNEPLARTEAVSRLVRAVELAGGVPDVLAVRSSVVKYPAAQRSGEEKGRVTPLSPHPLKH